MSILEAAKHQQHPQQATRKNSPGRNHPVLLSAKSQSKNYRRKQWTSDSNTLSSRNLTATLTAKGCAENGFVGLMTRTAENPRCSGRDRHSRYSHLVPL